METKTMQDYGPVSADFPYESKYVEVHGSKIHYIEQGEGDPMLFIHGVPSSSYLWRNIIPANAKNARCIALDMIGMGKSDKPDIKFSVFDHIKYIEGFIKALNLKNITLVLHGWGSIPGFHYAMQHSDNIKALAFYEAHIRANVDWDMLSLPVQQFAALFDDREKSYQKVVKENFFIDTVLPTGVLRRLTDEELAVYRKPFQTPESRLPLWQYVQELPTGKKDSKVVELIKNYSDKLKQSDIPKLMFYAIPGFITTIETVQWAKNNLKNIEIVDLGEALHFIQETHPLLFANELAVWYERL